MRVLHLVNNNAHHHLLLDLAVALRRAGIEVVLGSLDGEGTLQAAARQLGFEAFALDWGAGAARALAVGRLARLLRARRVEVVHTHLTEASIVGLLAARLAGVRGRVVTRHHSDERLIYGSRAGVVVDQAIGRLLARHTVSISDAVGRALREIDHLPDERIRQVANGYDWSRVRSTPEAAAAVRRELKLGEDFVICHVGRIAWVPARQGWMKGQDRLIKAAAGARTQQHLHLVFLGGGETRELEQLAAGLGLGDRCRFLGHRSDVFDVMAAADIIAHPSWHEAQCQVLIEAMALGRPVISSTVGAARDIVLPDRTGWLVPADDHPGLVRAIEEAASDRERLRRFGAAGSDLVHALYPIEKMAAGYQSIYEEQLRRR